MCPKKYLPSEQSRTLFGPQEWHSTKAASAPGEFRHGWALHSRLGLLLRCLRHHSLKPPSFRGGEQSPARRIHALSSEESAVTLPHLSILPIHCTSSSSYAALSHKPPCCESLGNRPLHTAHLSNIWHFPHGLWSHPQASDSRDPVILCILYHHYKQVTTQVSHKAT